MTTPGARVRITMDRLPRLTRELREKVDAQVAVAAHELEANAKRRILGHGLVDTGNLLNSVKGRKIGEAHWVVEVGANYGIYHEMGTRYLPARPFLHPAGEDVRRSFLAAMAEILRAA